jgi:hypothetical protein
MQRRGGRKRIVAPDASEFAPSSKPQPDGTLVKALARAHRWQRVLESGKYGNLAELSAAELTMLAPHIVERILADRPTAGLAQFLRPFPVEWERELLR